jgi:O-antigen/teichoic acid export membrane protein
MANSGMNASTLFDPATSGPETGRPTVRLRKAMQSATRRWSGKAIYALLDQGLISGAGFVMTILLARTLLPRDYGTFAIAYQVFLFLTILYGAFILEPLVVFGSSNYRDRLRRYVGALLRIHSLVGMAVVCLVGAAAWIFFQFARGQSLAYALLAVSVAAPCVLLFWLARRAFYVEIRPREAVFGAAVYFAVVIGGLLVVYRFGRVTPAKAFLLMAAGGVATAVTMFLRLRTSLVPGAGGPALSEVLRKHWGYGRWAAGSAVTIWFSGALYYPLLGSLRGLAKAGELKALMNFASPVSQVFVALSLLSLPYAARVHHRDGPAGARRLVWKLTALYGGGAILYWVTVVAWRGQLVRLLYAGRYADVAYLMPWVAVGSILRLSATAQAVTLRAMQAPALVFVAYSGSCLAALLVGVPCAWAFGLRGAVIAFALSNGVALVVALIMVQIGFPITRIFAHFQSMVSRPIP